MRARSELENLIARCDRMATRGMADWDHTLGPVPSFAEIGTALRNRPAPSRDEGPYGAASCAFWLIGQFAPYGRMLAGVSEDPEIVLGPLVLTGGETIQCAMTCHEDMLWSYYIEIDGEAFRGECPRWVFPADLQAALDGKMAARG